MRFPQLLTAFTLCLALAGCAPRGASPDQAISTASPGAAQTATPSVAPDAAIVTKLNSFSQNLYARAAAGQKGNLAVSPLGSFILLDMLYEGSTGPAHDEMAKVMGFSPDSLAQVGTLVKTLDALPSLSLAQKIYLDEKAKLVETYLQKVGPLLDEPVQVVPFADDPPGAVKIVNEWVETRTKGLIKDFLKPLPPLTVSVLVSVLHFQGKWAYQFPAQATLPAPFTPLNGAAYQVPMMSVTLTGWQPPVAPKAQAVVLPYTDDTEMLLLLPNPGSSPDDVLATVDPGLGLGMKPQGEDKVIVDLPRFEFEVPTFELTQAWAGVGLSKTVGNPDLTPMLRLEPPSPLQLMVFHKTYIKVNEEGTEAAAATAVVIMRKGTSSEEGSPPQRIRFDRPFAFVLRHSISGAVLMMGRVESPDKAVK